MSTNVIQVTGRRKTATANVKLSKGNGKITINGRDLNDYFGTVTLQEFAISSLTLVNSQKEYNAEVKVCGGGLSGQAGAIRHAMARALIQANPDFRSQLKSAGYLTRDPRMKERKKSGQPGARKRFQFSKR